MDKMAPIKRVVSRGLESLFGQVVALLLVIAWLVVTVFTYSEVVHNSNQTRALVNQTRATANSIEIL